MNRYFYFLMIAILPLLGQAATISISLEAWSQLRDIHALHTENVNNEKWDPKTANTEVFLSKTLKTYFLELIDEKNQLAERNTILLSDNQKLQEDNKSLHHDCDTLRTKNNVYIVIIIILLVLFGVLALIPIICSIKQKKKTLHKIPENECPRCGNLIDLQKKECPNCGTHI